MRRRTKRIGIGVVALVVLVVAGSFIYARLLYDSDAALTEDDVIARIDAATDHTDGSNDIGSDASAEGDWIIGAESVVGYRVRESINGFDVEATGRTSDVTGALTIEGTAVTKADFVVDMTTVVSDDSRRDSQFRGRIMETADFPTASFALTSPIDFGGGTNGSSNLQDGISVEVSATGDLTLHGVTRSVTFPLSATVRDGRIGILGSIPITFADYDIDNPSFATITTEDRGSLEFVLVLSRA